LPLAVGIVLVVVGAAVAWYGVRSGDEGYEAQQYRPIVGRAAAVVAARTAFWIVAAMLALGGALLIVSYLKH
jgi:hypothetical protein